jgi:hypothetical protein
MQIRKQQNLISIKNIDKKNISFAQASLKLVVTILSNLVQH